MEVKLHHKAEFEKILADYSPSYEAVRILKDIPLVILLGVSGGGRNTVINHLVNTGKYHFVVSDTTRPPKVRDGVLEKEGVNYFFRSEDDMLADLLDGKFLEAEVLHNQQVSGISIRELKRASESGKIPVNEVDLEGTLNIRKAKPDAEFFFIVPPSYKEWMRRLNGREQMTPVEMKNRMQTAMKILRKALTDDHFIFVINDDSLKSAHRIDEIVHSGKGSAQHTEGRKIAKQILTDIKNSGILK